MFIGPGDLGDKYTSRSEKALSDLGWGQVRQVPKGAVLCTCIGSTIGKMSVASEPLATNQQINAVVASEDNDTEFIYYALNRIAPRMRLLAGEQAVPMMNKTDFGQLEVLRPPLPEQRRIAQVLGAWDRAIAMVQQLLAAQQERKRGLMQELLTERRRFKGFGGKWVKRSVGEMIEESRIPVAQPDPERRITVRLHLGGVEHRQVRGTEAIDATGYFHRKAGQFIYGKQNLHKGAMGIVPRELNGFESTQDIPAFDFLTGTHPPFFLYLMSRPGWYPQLEKFATGTGSKRIHPEQLYQVSLRMPPTLDEQVSIANAIGTLDAEMGYTQHQLDHLTAQKRGLMQQLLTGAVRVKP
jgi:type I restriction enzyme S subunit